MYLFPKVQNSEDNLHKYARLMLLSLNDPVGFIVTTSAENDYCMSRLGHSTFGFTMLSHLLHDRHSNAFNSPICQCIS